MPKSNYVYEQGEGIFVGTHGDTDYVYQSGDPVSNTGVSSFVFESGTGLGGGNIVIEGTTVPVFETAESHKSFYAYDNNADTHATGLKSRDVNAGYNAGYILVHKNTNDGSYAIIFWGFHADTSDSDVNSARMEWNGLGAQGVDGTTPIQGDDPVGDESGEGYLNSADGDPINDNAWNPTQGDGVVWPLPSGSYTVDIELLDHSDYYDSNNNADTDTFETWVGVGPDGVEVTKSAPVGSTFTVEVNL